MRNHLDRSLNFFTSNDLFGFSPVFERFFDESVDRRQLVDERPVRSQAAHSQTVHSEAVLTPACDITEAEHAFVVTLDMPGVAKDEIKIEAIRNQLIVTAERRDERVEQDGKWHLRGRSFGRYQRAFTLGDSVDAERIEASYGDGVLQITLPKAELAKPRSIKIQAMSDGKATVNAKAVDAKNTEVPKKEAH